MVVCVHRVYLQVVVDFFFGSVISLLDRCTISCGTTVFVIVVLSFITSEQKKTRDRGQGETYDVKVKDIIHRKTCKSQKETHHVSVTKSVEEIELVKGQDFYYIRTTSA